ncbi:putative glycylpeptide N-tetradecanoyltransferase [Powai lake megavirus]|uniref:glycylpeptide N-tetradecanoyltransferase n=1 Tax=Powai lake megavirus TaxID=1842663 RepID=A0A161HR60_9VIRU|nr:putative glycylpeptide N-tetradecanoyltransferase [Powai lake megavirus]ANB50841.1 putative glycylpeptide N-tetradecanoyltransferase [Powai lake megavirus]
MTFWNKQPLNISTQNNICVINKNIDHEDINLNNNNLPNGFSLKTLNCQHLDEIHDLLSKHYVQDQDNIIRLLYSKDFLYWYLKYVPHGFIIGLTHNCKIIGLITALFVDMIICGEKIKIPYINFLCVQSKIRYHGMAIFLMNEMKKRLLKINIMYSLFTTTKNISFNFSSIQEFAIPINYSKLRQVDFLVDDIPSLPIIDNNPLHLLKQSDMNIVVNKLNKFMDHLQFKPFFNQESGNHFLLPKKNIVYTFVKYNDKNEVTDMISVYKNFFYCLEKNKIISVAHLSFYFFETLSITELVFMLLDKLSKYGFDQLIFRDHLFNSDINITKFSTDSKLKYYLYNVSIKEIMPCDMCFFPF